MKIIIKTLKNEQFPIEIELNDTILILKQKIQELRNIEVSAQKLVHKAKMTQDDKTLEEIGVKEGDFFVITVSKKTNPPPQPPVVQPPVNVPVNNPVTGPMNQPVVQPNNPEQGGSSGNDICTGQAYNKAIEEIQGMGFEKDLIVKAMKAAYNNPDRAIDYLLNGIPEQPQGEQVGQGGQGGQGLGGMGGGLQGNPLAQLAQNPGFQQLRTAVQQNPQLLQPLLNNIAQNNPQLFQIINQNQQAFLQLLAGGDGEGGLGGESGSGGNIGQQTIQITQEEKEAIDRICALGFDKRDAFEAFRACENDENLAVNFLLEQQSQGQLYSDFIEQEQQLDQIEQQQQGGQQGQQGQSGQQQPPQNQQQQQQPPQDQNQQNQNQQPDKKDEDDDNIFN